MGAYGSPDTIEARVLELLPGLRVVKNLTPQRQFQENARRGTLNLTQRQFRSWSGTSPATKILDLTHVIDHSARTIEE